MLPRQYTKMVKAFTDDPKALWTVLTTLVLVWLVVFGLNVWRESHNIEIFPKGLHHHVRKELYDHVVHRY